MRYYLVILALALPQFSFAAPRTPTLLNWFEGPANPVPTNEVDPNENFISEAYGQTLGEPLDIRLFLGIRRIREHVALPNSLIESFLLALERKPEHLGASLHVLIGDAGASGTSSLVKQYLEFSARPARTLSQETDLQEIVVFLRKNPSGIILLNEAEKIRPSFLERLKDLFVHNEFLSSGTIIVTTKAGSDSLPAIQTRNETLDFIHRLSETTPFGFLNYADSIHLVRNPLNEKYYESVIRAWASDDSAKFARLSGTIIADLARVAMRFQISTRRSQIRFILSLLESPLSAVRQASILLDCKGALGESNPDELIKPLLGVAQQIQTAAEASR